MPFPHIVFTRNSSAYYSHQLVLFTPPPSVSHNSYVHISFYHSRQLLLFSLIPPIVYTNSSSCSHQLPYCSHQLLLFTIPVFTPTPTLSNSSSCTQQLLLFTPSPVVHQPTPTVHSNSYCLHQLCYYSQLLCSYQLFLLFTLTLPIVHTISYCSPTNSYYSYQLLLLFTPTPAIIHNSYVHTNSCHSHKLLSFSPIPPAVHTNSCCSQQLLLLFAPVPPLVHTNSRALFKRN